MRIIVKYRALPFALLSLAMIFLVDISGDNAKMNFSTLICNVTSMFKVVRIIKVSVPVDCHNVSGC
jgi:hypothetical protein